MTQALIIGAGIAGPLTAIALHKASVSATVYEAYPESSGLEAGAWLTVAVNGLDAMRTLDLHRAIMERGFPSERIEFVNGSNRSLGTLPIGGTLVDGTVTHTVKRADLYRCIAEEAQRRGIRIEYGKRLLRVDQDGGGVVAHFEDGSTAQGDFLVGADGVRSRVRNLIDPDAPAARYTGLGNVGGFCARPLAGLTPGIYRMVFGKRAFFGYTVAPSGEVWWFANPPRTNELTRDELRATSQESLRATLMGLFEEDDGPMVELISKTEGSLVMTNQYDLRTVPRWHDRRVSIVGDAAHAASPSSGQGVSMAAEDAVTLAKCVRDAPDVPSALARFETERRPRTERVVAYGTKYASSKTVGPVGRVFRDLMLPFVFRMQNKRLGPDSLAWLFRHHIEWAELPLERNRGVEDSV